MQGVQWERVALWTHGLTWPRRGSRRWLCALRQRSHDWKVWPWKHHCVRGLLPAGSGDGQASVPSGANFFFNLNFRLFWLLDVEYNCFLVLYDTVEEKSLLKWTNTVFISDHKTIKECTAAKAEPFQSKLILHCSVWTFSRDPFSLAMNIILAQS